MKLADDLELNHQECCLFHGLFL